MQSETATRAAEFTWLEVAALIYESLLDHPVPGTSSKGNVWVDRALAPFSGDVVVSVASRIRYVAGLFRVMDRLFSLNLIFARGLDRSGLGIFCPLPGVVLYVTDAAITKMEARLGDFTYARPVRKANDLSRPFQRV